MTNPFIDPATKIPVVVPVNSAFNKQAVAENGYAIPDNADENLTCVSGPNEGELMVNYPGTFPKFIPGFFGIVPGTMPASFFDGANVTIVKLAVNDTETGQEEAGQVRFHVTYDLGLEDEAQYHIPISGNDVTGNSTVNNLVPALYAASPTIPNGPGVQYWVEGVTPGPITLQFTYTKGNITISQKQQFLVCTQQSKADWQAEIAQAILLETGSVNMTSYYPDYLTSGGTFLFEPNMSTSPFWNNYQFIQAVYGYYGELYNKSNGLFLWTGLAHMGAGPVYGGLVDSEYLRTIPNGNITDFAALDSLLTSANLSAGINYVQDNLIYAHYSIYDDLTWQFEAYQSSGIWALRYTNQNHLDVESSLDQSIDMTHWNEMYHGDWSSNPSLVQDANYYLIVREQSIMAQRGWDRLNQPYAYVPAFAWIETIPSFSATKVLSDLAQSPLPSGPTFRTVEGSTADISSFPVRFDWMVETTRYTSIWNQWLSLSPASRMSEANTSVYDQSQNYSFYYYWLDEPILGY